MSFIWPKMLLSLTLVPLFIGLYFRLQRKRQQELNTLGPLGIVQNPKGNILGVRRHLSPLFFLFGVALLLFGLARPQMTVSLPRVEGTVILAFDVSNSMLAKDLEPTRIDAAKIAARSFVEKQPSTILIGVVAFSDGGLIVQPPTNDQTAVMASIDRLTPQGGTSLGQGIFTSLNAIAGETLAFDESTLQGNTQSVQIGDFSSNVILLLSDGENTERLDPLEIAQVAAEAGVRIYSIGIGSPEGDILQIDGFNILTQLNETTLKEIVNLTNGFYFHAEDEESLQDIYDNVDLQLTVKGEDMEITSIVAGFSVVFFLIGGVLSLIWFGRLP